MKRGELEEGLVGFGLVGLGVIVCVELIKWLM